MLPASADRVEAVSRGLDVVLILVWVAHFVALLWLPITKQSVYMGPLVVWAAVALAVSALLILGNLGMIAWLYIRRRPHAHRATLLFLGAIAISVLLVAARGQIVHQALSSAG